MANLREIKKRITSTTSMKQITRTMEMVSTAKIRRALERAYAAEPYKDALTDVMLTVAQDAEAAGDAPLLARHDAERRVLVVAIASDRGLAGGFNVGVAREAEKIMHACAEKGEEVELITCGRKPTEYFSRRANVVMHFEGSSAEPTLEQARMMATPRATSTAWRSSTTTPRTASTRSCA